MKALLMWWNGTAVTKMSGAVETISQEKDAERRDLDRAHEREIGRVISCDGGFAILATSTSQSEADSSEIWSIGRLITIAVGESRIVGLIYKLFSTGSAWEEAKSNAVQAQIELVGEIRDVSNGQSVFSRGIINYPPLGSVAHKIRSSDLMAIHLPYSKRSMVIGSLSQDNAIPAAVDIDSMLSRHFAIVGTTGTGNHRRLPC